MGKRYMAIYLYEFLFSVLLLVVLYFVARFYFIDFYYLAFAPEEKDFSEGEYWRKMFFEGRIYFTEIENFYNSIEDWNFDSIGISVEKLGKEFIYSPSEPLYFNESESETYDLKLVDEGWYFLKRCSNQIPVILY